MLDSSHGFKAILENSVVLPSVSQHNPFPPNSIISRASPYPTSHLVSANDVSHCGLNEIVYGAVTPILAKQNFRLALFWRPNNAYPSGAFFVVTDTNTLGFARGSVGRCVCAVLV